MEIATILVLLSIVATIAYVSFEAVKRSQQDSQADVAVMSVVLAQRSAASATGMYVNDPAALSTRLGGMTVTDGNTASTTPTEVSMHMDNGAVWLVAKGDTCRFTHLADIADRMTTTSGILTTGTCTASNPALPTLLP